MTERTYKLGNSTITLKFGDITKTNTQIIVSSDDYYLSMGGGVSAAILRAGGNEIALDAAKKVPAQLGDVIITTAGRLKSKFVFHAITIGRGNENIQQPDIVKLTTIKCLELMTTLSANSISFPASGTGVAKFSLEHVAIEMSKAISIYLSKSKAQYEIVIYLFDAYNRMTPADYIAFFESFAMKVPQFKDKQVNEPEQNDRIGI
jgi:O-acetyl-ADP-ribose deacetylase (regulator of RNase III)